MFFNKKKKDPQENLANKEFGVPEVPKKPTFPDNVVNPQYMVSNPNDVNPQYNLSEETVPDFYSNSAQPMYNNQQQFNNQPMYNYQQMNQQQFNNPQQNSHPFGEADRFNGQENFHQFGDPDKFNQMPEYQQGYNAPQNAQQFNTQPEYAPQNTQQFNAQPEYQQGYAAPEVSVGNGGGCVNQGGGLIVELSAARAVQVKRQGHDPHQ